jgi:hypothetical protein
MEVNMTSTDTTTVTPQADVARPVEPPSSAQVRAALVELVNAAGETGLTNRELIEKLADRLPAVDTDLDTAMATLVLLGVLADSSGRLRRTELTARFLEGQRLASVG